MKTRQSRSLVIAFCSGRAGVGKATVIVNLAAAAQERGLSCLIWDLHPEAPSLHLHYGLNPIATASDAYLGSARIEDVPIRICPTTWLVPERALGKEAERQLAAAFPTLLSTLLNRLQPELVLLNLPPGWSELIAVACRMAALCCVVTGDDIGSILDTYGLLKALLSETEGRDRYSSALLVVGVVDEAEAQTIVRKLNTVLERFVGKRLPLLGAIPYEPWHRKALLHQRPLVELFPDLPAALLYRKLLQQLSTFRQEEHDSALLSR